MQSASLSQKAYERIIKELRENKTVTICPQGTSMFPFLMENKNLVTLKAWQERPPRRGDVVLYRRDSQLLILHRLWRIKKDGYYFVGDNQTETEGPIDASQLIATVVSITGKGRTYSVRHPVYYTLSRLWLVLRPVRPLITKPARKILCFLHLWNGDS